jgi:zinc protease
MVLVDYIFGGGFLNSRLTNRIRQKEGLSYDVSSYFSVNQMDKSGSLQVSASFAPENASKVETALKEELEKAIRDGFTKEEVEAAKTGLLQTYRVSLSKDASLSRMLANYLFLNRTMKWEDEFEKRIAA